MVALLAGVLVASRSYNVGEATAQVLVDTPQSQVVGDSSSMSPGGGLTLETLGTQASLLAGLMVQGPIKTDIAQRAGLNPNRLIGSSAAVTVPADSGSAVGPSSVSIPSGPDVFALTTQILTDSAGQNTLPIIQINTQAPDRSEAIRLANAAVAGLQAFIRSTGVAERIGIADRLSITNGGVSEATTETRGPSLLVGALVALGVLLLGCAAILWIQGVIGGTRSASEREPVGLGVALEDDVDRVPHDVVKPVALPPRPVVPRGKMGGRPVRPQVGGGSLRRQIGTGTNTSPGKLDRGRLSLAADDSAPPTEETPGESPDSSSRQRSSHQT